MKNLFLPALLGVALLAAPGLSRAEEGAAVTYVFDGSFEDATFAVENAIIAEGLIVDHVSHVGEMLARTGADVGSDVKVFDGADVYSFCSASLSRKVMEADPMNLRYCPYGVFVMARAGAVTVGYRQMPEGPMQEVETLLDRIAKAAVE
jgi:uncharacterized protein (DUF302 family)